jgi:ribosomal protein L11 methyltransferase
VHFRKDEETKVYDFLDQRDIHTFESSPNRRSFWVRLYGECEAELKKVQEEFKQILQKPRMTLEPVVVNWQNEYHKYLKPVRISDHLLVVPPAYHDIEFDGVKIVIEPNLVFGSGGHPTTVMMLQLLSKAFERKHPTVLDVGCGSGILSIAAAKFGAKRVLGIDIDPLCIENSELNSTGNGDRISQFRCCEVSAVEERFDICCVNIISSVVQPMWSQLINRVQPGGFILVSGFTTEEELDWYCRGMRVVEALLLDDWMAVLLQTLPIDLH